jgi:hypothetical protein
MAVAMKFVLLALALGFLVHGQDVSEDVRRVAALDPAPRTKALRALLNHRAEEEGMVDAVFYRERRLRSPLLGLLSDPDVGGLVRNLVSLIAMRDDLRRMELLPVVSKPVFDNRWAYGVVCAMLEPASEQEWAFLRRAALGGFDDRWVDAGAIQTLKLIASPRSRQILEETPKANASRAEIVARALAYVASNPAPLIGEDLPGLAERVAQVVKIGNWEGNRPPRYNAAGDMALIDFAFRLPEDELTYTATFHRVEGAWRLRGVRETRQASLPPPITIRRP